MKNQAPAFQAYANELLALSTGLSLEAVGAVHRLFLVMWGQSADQSSIIDDDEMLARTVGASIESWKKLRLEIQHPGRPVFEEKNGRFISFYLRHEAAKQRKYRKTQSEKGKRSAQLRLNRGSTVVEPMRQPKGNSSSSLSSSSSSSLSLSSKEKKRSQDSSPAIDHEFEEFWNLYPARNGKKLEKGQALAKFSRLTPEDRQLVLVAVKNYAVSEMIQKGIGIKDAHRWLRNGKDEEPWRDWITPEEKPKEKTHGHSWQRPTGLDRKDYAAGSF